MKSEKFSVVRSRKSWAGVNEMSDDDYAGGFLSLYNWLELLRNRV